jgi:uncharacterized protein (DUF488 family)
MVCNNCLTCALTTCHSLRALPKNQTWLIFCVSLSERQVEQKLSPSLFDVPTVLLCSEATAEQCHRRLVLEYLSNKWGNIEMVHL